MDGHGRWLKMKRLTTSVPCTQQVHTTGEKARLQETQNDPEACHLAPVRGETHPNHAGTPEQCDTGQVESRPQRSNDDGRRRLEQNVGDEEDEGSNGLIKSNIC